MDKDRVRGKSKDIKGRIKRQAGEWTGREDLQAEGAAEQIEGKARSAFGKVKDEGRNIAADIRRDVNKKKRERQVKGKKAA